MSDAQAYSLVYNRRGSPDGASPSAGLIRDFAGNFYGTTPNGGASGNGTIFKLDPAGNETILHSFAGGPSNGAEPLYAGLVMDSAGNLYGTTLAGGNSGAGTVYKNRPLRE